VKIELSKGDSFWIVLVILFIGVGFVYGYGGNQPSTMGHSWKEINFDNEFCRFVTGNDCGGVGSPSSTCVVSSWSPSADTVCSGTSFTQTSNCGTTRSVSGTKNCVVARCSSFSSNKGCDVGGVVLWSQWGLNQAQCLAKCEADTNVACCHHESSNFCAGRAVPSVPIFQSGISAAACSGATDLRCTALYTAKAGPGYTTCPAKDSTWCIASGQSYSSHYCSGGYVYINCKETGMLDTSGKCCGINTKYCTGDVIPI